MSEHHNFVLRPAADLTTAMPISETLTASLESALKGGSAARELLAASLGPLQHFYALISASGDEIWLDGTTDTGNPVKFVEEGEYFLTVGADFTDLAPLENGTGGPDDLAAVGMSYVVLTTSEGTSQQIVREILYGGDAILNLGDAETIPQLLSPIVQSMTTYVQDLAKKVLRRAGSISDPQQALNLLQLDSAEAAEDSARTGVKVGDLIVDVVQQIGEGDVLKAVGSLAQVFVVALLQKPMYDYVRLYNATGLDLDFGVCWAASGAAAEMAPAPVGETAVLPAVGPTASGTGVGASAEALYYSDLLLINSELKEGVSFVLQGEPQDGFPGLRAMVDVPSRGANSLFVSLDAEDCETVWNGNQGKDTSLTASVLSQGGRYRLQIATNQNQGKSPSPVNAAEGYNYCHVLVLSDTASESSS